jgi:streptomycin 6-kinase
MALVVPDPVRRKAVAVGPEGERWLDGLDELVRSLAEGWALRVGDVLAGGSGALVAEAVDAAGDDVVLKVAIPDGLEGHSPFDEELRVLRLGDGQGYVRVLHADPERRAMVQERLGRPLADLALPVEAQIDAIADTLGQAWRRPAADVGLRTGADQATFLAGFVRRLWTELDRPCPPATIEVAERFAGSRQAAFDPSSSVVVHGDAHATNVLEDPGDPDGRSFKLIDPDGMLSEPAHDLAVPLRDWTEELLAGDPAPVARAWCARLAERAGVEPGPIWEWAFLERVSTGLFLLGLGDPQGRRLLAVADRLAATAP